MLSHEDTLTLYLLCFLSLYGDSNGFLFLFLLLKDFINPKLDHIYNSGVYLGCILVILLLDSGCRKQSEAEQMHKDTNKDEGEGEPGVRLMETASKQMHA